MTVAEFNRRVPIGSPVIAYPGVRPEHPAKSLCTRLETRTRSTARLLGDEPVVWVEGHAGCIALTHIDIVGGAL